MIRGRPSDDGRAFFEPFVTERGHGTADRGYDSDAIREDLPSWRRYAWDSTNKNRRVQHSADCAICALRSRIERFIGPSRTAAA